MAWKLSSWLALVRAAQLLAALVCAGLNGFLIAYIYLNNLGLTQMMVSLEWLICSLIVYTSLNLLIIHTGNRSSKPGWLTVAIILDFTFCGADLSIITLLAHAGVPTNCGGLTHDDYDDEFTNGFSDMGPSHFGRLDNYCTFERSFYSIAICIVFSYMISVVLSVLQICASKYTSNDHVVSQLNRLRRTDTENQYELVDKLDDAPLQSTSLITSAVAAATGGPSASSPRIPPPAPQSEGVTSPRASMHVARAPSLPPVLQNLGPTPAPGPSPVSARGPAPVRAPPRPTLHRLSTHRIPRKEVPSPPYAAAAVASSSRDPPPPSPPSSKPLPPLIPGMPSDEDDGAEAMAAAAMVADGPRFSRGYQPGRPLMPPPSPTKSPTKGPPPLIPGMPSEEDEADGEGAEAMAAAAMVTDGSQFAGRYQPGGPSTLPPYTPGSPGPQPPRRRPPPSDSKDGGRLGGF